MPSAPPPLRERPAAKETRSTKDFRDRQEHEAKASASSRGKASGPIGAAPWQDGDDPWSKTTDPWAKAGAVDPWAAGPSAKQPARPPQHREVPSKASGPRPDRTSPRPDKSWGGNFAPAAASTAPARSAGKTYDLMDMLQVRECLLQTNAMGSAPASLSNFRTLRIPNMESSERRLKRSDRDRGDRSAREERRSAPAGADDERGGGDRSRDSPMREARRPEPTRAPEGASSATAAVAGPSVTKREEEKPKEESKANCPTQ